MSSRLSTGASQPAKRLSGKAAGLPKLPVAPQPQPAAVATLNLSSVRSPSPGRTSPLPNSGRRLQLEALPSGSPGLSPTTSHSNGSTSSPLPPVHPSSSSSSISSAASAENIQVCVRIRPGANFEDRSLYSWELTDADTKLVDGTKDGGSSTPFYFNRVYRPDVQTETVYANSIQHVILQFAQGFNGTIFAYGQTASGKTHTMMGTAATPGLIPQAIRQIFALMEADKSSVYLLRVSMLEIYNEETNDLLNSNTKTSKNLAMREVAGQFKVVGLTETVVSKADDVFEAIEKGNANRKVGVSNLNEHSSRSHSIFRLTLESAVKTNTTGTVLKNKLSGAVKVSELNLVDLAGSETLSYDFGSAQQKETKSINLSLTQLKSVISALSKQEQFVPFRNSSLTKLLRNSLGGNAKTVLVCTLNPMPVHIKTTKNTLQFGQMASSVTNKARVNEVIDDSASMIKQQQQQIANLQAKLANVSAIEEEKSRIQNEYLLLQKHLSELQRKEAEHADLKRQMSEASRMVVGGEDPATINLMNNITVSTVSEEELAALSSQLSELQSAKNALEQSKLDLESKLRQQLEHQSATEQEIRKKADLLESITAKAEQDQFELSQMSKLMAEKEKEDLALHQQLLQQQEQLRLAQEESTRKSNEAKRKHLEELAQQQELAQKNYQAQLTILEEAKKKNQAQEAEMKKLHAEQLAKEESLRKQVKEMESSAAKTNKVLQDQLASLAAEKNKLQSERNELNHLNQAAKERWDREMLLQGASGLDKDSYLARMIDRYENERDDMKNALQEAESLRLVAQLAAEDEIAKLKRQLAAAQASIAAPSAAASSSSSPPPQQPFPQPPPVQVEKGEILQLPSLVLPGVIELKESDELLSTPTTNLPMCSHCGSKDRLKAEKMRSLCNHARKTLDFQFKNTSQLQKRVAELEAIVKLYGLSS